MLFAVASSLLIGCEVPSGSGKNLQSRTATSQQNVAVEGGLAPMVMEAPAMVLTTPSPASPRPASSSGARPTAGIVTAADIDDTLNFPAFLRYLERTDTKLGLGNIAFTRPVLAQLSGPSGEPAPGLRFTLRKPNSAEVFYDGYSGVDSNISIFPQALGIANLRNVEMRVFPNGEGPVFSTQFIADQTRQTISLLFNGRWEPNFLELVFVVDTTGSMSDELAWLNQEITGIVRSARRTAPDVDIRFGLITYKAPADPYAVKSYGFTNSVRQFASWVGGETASGGAGGPEVVADALAAAMQLDWRRGKGERLIFHVGDEAPLGSKTGSYYKAAQIAAEKGIQVFNLAASGVDPHLEFLMRQSSALTSGRYIFLTDDSDIGLGHAEPTVSCYQVIRLNDLISRVLKSELSGQRVEPNSSEVIREVGTYRGGRCLN